MNTRIYPQNCLRDLLRAALDRLTPLDRLRQRSQAGMTTAEYAVGTLAACSQHTSRS